MAGRFWESAEMGLEVKLEALERRVEALEAKLTPKAPPPEPMQVVGFDRPLPRAAVPANGFKMPSDAELRQLMARVHAAHPSLADLDGLVERGDTAIDAEFINYKGDIRKAIFAKQFKLSFIALSHFRRLEEADPRRYVSHWQDEAASVLAGLGQAGETLKFNPFVTAALAHGDIPYSGLGMGGRVPLSLGLSRHSGAAAMDSWRRVLDYGPLAMMGEAREARPDRHGQQPVTVTRL
jgi:hypothetical protein